MINDRLPAAAVELEQRSHREALRSSAIIGGSQVVSIAMGLVRTKLAAVILGPAGIGAIGLLQTLLQTASNLASGGIGTSGTRQIAESKTDEARQWAVRRALRLVTLVCGLLGAAITFSLSSPIARLALGDERQSSIVAWLSIGVFLTVITFGQNSVLIGLRRIGDSARMNIVSSLGAAIIGVTAILVWHQDGVIAFVLATPAAMALIGLLFIRRLPRAPANGAPASRILPEAVRLLKLGAAFAVAGTVSAFSQLAFRSILGQSASVAALGQFQAAWFISMTYVGFVLQAMGADYYPRLTSAIAKREPPARLVQEQIEVALALAGPVLLGTIAVAPIVIWLLYSAEFAPAAWILRWQILADVLKVASFPLGYLLLAQGRAWTFMALELTNNIVMLAALAVLLPLVGIEASGIAVLVSYVTYLVSVAVAVWRPSGLGMRAMVIRQFAALLAAAIATFIAAFLSFWAGLVVGLALAGIFAILAVRRLDHALPTAARRLSRRLFLIRNEDFDA